MQNSNEDNMLYPVGTLISAIVNPALPLIIDKCYQMIYYCTVVGSPDHKHFAYFEWELIPPRLNK
jgi:hypothetical protein